MKSELNHFWIGRLALVAILSLTFSAARAEESERKAAAGGEEKATQGGRFSRLAKGLGRPFGGDPAKKASANKTAPESAAPGKALAADPATKASANRAASPGGAERAPVSGPAQPEYVIGPEDLLAINVWQEPQVSRAVPVRPDGKISLPLAGELQASGLTPLKLRARITEALKPYLANPEVTVIVEKVSPPKFNILGEVQRPGSYDMAKGINVLDAIALAGGFREFAKVKEIYVLRRGANGSPARLPFNYKEVAKGKNFSQNVEIEPGDTIVVP